MRLILGCLDCQHQSEPDPFEMLNATAPRRASRLWRRFQPLATSDMPLDVPPPRDARFGSPLTLSRVHWVRPEMVAEDKYLTWTEDNLLRQVVYEGLREDKPAAEVRRAVPHPKSAEPARPASHSKRPRVR